MKKHAIVLKLAQDIRASYWFIPAIMVIGALIFAQISEWLDHNPDILPIQLPDSFIDTQVEGARSTLSTIATAVIGVTGVMFSMTILAVSFAAANYGPRLIGNFMRDRGNQISLGILISTFVYALSILRAVQDPSESAGIEAFVPQYSMMFAMLGSLISVVTLIYFVHHVPETINVSNITASLGYKLQTAIEELIDAEAELDRTSRDEPPDTDPTSQLTLESAGYIRALQYGRLAELCTERSWTMEIKEIPGDFVTPFTPVLDLWSDTDVTDEDYATLRDCFAIGTSRSEYQNVFFLIDELVEVLARALSPGINDPFTAINCLNWMFNALTVARQYENGLANGGASNHRLAPPLEYSELFKRSMLHAKPYCDPDHLASAHYDSLVNDLNRMGK